MTVVPELSLSAGLAALKQGNYSEAIAHLEGVSAFFTDKNVILIAQMGLVVSYNYMENTNKAIALCQHLSENSQPKFQLWATNTLTELLNTGKISEDLISVLWEDSEFLDLQSMSSQDVKFKAPSKVNRIQKWHPLKPLSLKYLWLVEAITIILFCWWLFWLMRFGMDMINNILPLFPYGRLITFFYADPTLAIAIFLIILLCAAPWLIDALLKQFYEVNLLSLSELSTQAPEAAKLIPRFCRQRRIPQPKLLVLPISVPLAFTYGNLPRYARIVVSQGLLSKFTEEQITTIYAGELGHIFYRDFIFMSVIILVLQCPYIIYRQVATWGDILSNKIKRLNNRKVLLIFLRILQLITTIVSALSYIIYALVKVPVLGFSRVRVYYSDHVAVEVTGNPNGLTSALLKLAISIAQNIQTPSATTPLLESFDLIIPLGYTQAITLGSCYPHRPFEQLLGWDCLNLYRHWLTINYTHPLIGDRFLKIAEYAKYLLIKSELNLLTKISAPVRLKDKIGKLINVYKAFPILPNSLFYGLLIGLALRAVIWSVGWIGDFLNMWEIIWMHKPGEILEGCVLMGFSSSIFLQINSYFPDIKPKTARKESDLPDLITNPDILPSNSISICITGKLLGRSGMSNWLGQDLILETPMSLIKLNFLSHFGIIGNLLPQRTRPVDLVSRQITVTGWFRRGVTPWIDVETLRTQGGKTISKAHYPVWVTILGCVTGLWGIYLIWQCSW